MSIQTLPQILLLWIWMNENNIIILFILWIEKKFYHHLNWLVVMLNWIYPDSSRELIFYCIQILIELKSLRNLLKIKLL